MTMEFVPVGIRKFLDRHIETINTYLRISPCLLFQEFAGLLATPTIKETRMAAAWDCAPGCESEKHHDRSGGDVKLDRLRNRESIDLMYNQEGDVIAGRQIFIA